MRNFRDLKVGEKALDFAVKIYEATRQFPGSEQFGLRSQMQRAAASIGSNIAEGSYAADLSRFSL